MGVLDELGELPQKLVILTTTAGLVFLGSGLGFLALYLLHQLTLWLSSDPERAFHKSRLFISTVGSVYDTVGVLYNSLLDVVLLAIPAWNAGVLYVIQPAVFTSVEILAMAFTGRPYNGILTDDTLRFEGHMCPADGSVGPDARWCGVASAYSAQLGYSVAENGYVANDTLPLSSRTARRLSLEVGEPLIAALDLSFLTDSLQALIASLITIGGLASDIFFHVAYEVLSLVFKALFDAFMMLVRALGGAVMMVFQSGTFMEVLMWGIDLLIIMALDVGLPLLFAFIDLVICIFDLFKPDGWEQQLKCIAATCWQEGSDAASDTFHLFSSIPIVAERVETVFTKLVNSLTGQRFGQTASGSIAGPDMGDSGKGSPAAQACAACFTCRVSSCAHFALCIVSNLFVLPRCPKRAWYG